MEQLPSIHADAAAHGEGTCRPPCRVGQARLPSLGSRPSPTTLPPELTRSAGHSSASSSSSSSSSCEVRRPSSRTRCSEAACRRASPRQRSCTRSRSQSRAHPTAGPSRRQGTSRSGDRPPRGVVCGQAGNQAELAGALVPIGPPDEGTLRSRVVKGPGPLRRSDLRTLRVGSVCGTA
jgi:hypothetical protein